jgi:hypothetical protein
MLRRARNTNKAADRDEALRLIDDLDRSLPVRLTAGRLAAAMNEAGY